MDCKPQSRQYKNIGRSSNPHQKRDFFSDARHPESTHTGLHLQKRLYDYQQAYQLYLYEQVTVVETLVRKCTEMFFWTLPPLHTQQVSQP